MGRQRGDHRVASSAWVINPQSLDAGAVEPWRLASSAARHRYAPCLQVELHG